jgi:hypothetical protein
MSELEQALWRSRGGADPVASMEVTMTERRKERDRARRKRRKRRKAREAAGGGRTAPSKEEPPLRRADGSVAPQTPNAMRKK